MNKLITIICLFAIVMPLKAQYIEQFSISQGNGNKMIEIKNFPEAVRQFTALLEKEPNNIEYKFKLGKSYNYCFIDRKKALEILQEVSSSTNAPEGAEFELAIAFFRNKQFESAKETFNHLLLKELTEEGKKKLNKWILQCEQSEKMINEPVAVVFENLGKYVNSKAPDFLPICTPDESQIAFATKRNGVVGNLYDYTGYKTSDIYLVKHKRNKYSRARSIGSPNTYGNEFTAGRSENGKFLIYNVNSTDYYDDLFVSEKGRRSYMPPKVFDSDEVNKKTAETGATLTNDGTKMYFSSDREGGSGGFDIYWVKRLPNGDWGAPKNAGTSINTAGDEKFPVLMDKGSVLYFSSNGYPGMGGMDLFYSERKSEENWGKPVNLGYPINTPDDDLNISFSKSKRHAYIAADRDGGFGDLDVYRVTFLNEKIEYTILSGRLMLADSSVVSQTVKVDIFNLDNEDDFTTYLTNEKSGKFSAALAPGRYRVEVADLEGFQDFTKEIRLLGKNDFKAFVKTNFILTPD